MARRHPHETNASSPAATSHKPITNPATGGAAVYIRDLEPPPTTSSPYAAWMHYTPIRAPTYGADRGGARSTGQLTALFPLIGIESNTADAIRSS